MSKNLAEAKRNFRFELTAQDGKARAGVLQTPHGPIKTPVFMPVGTHGAIKALPPLFLENEAIILSNTYHLNLSPGERLIKKLGGLHKYMGWNKAILTDSGGFQVFSLKNKKITEEGVEFSPPGKKPILLSPEYSIDIQQALGSDIMMAFDECIPYPSSEDYVTKSSDRTFRWLKRCQNAWTNPKQALFGIIQGGTYQKLRERCADQVSSLDLPGYAIGGVSVGEGPELMQEIVSWTAPLMPETKPRYVMGVGTPEDLLFLWGEGVDMSDCIIPTKYARGGTLFTNRGKIRITHKNYRHDSYPIDTECSCYTCSHFTRSYLKHLFDSNEILGNVLATVHNLWFYRSLADRARLAIEQRKFDLFRKNFLNGYLKS